MKDHLKIAIFSGAIPSTTFIEHLIEGVAKTHQVLLFGVIEKHKRYSTKHIRIYKTPQSHILNLCYTLYRCLLLCLTNPKAIFQLIKEVNQYPTFYERWIWFSKFLPIILYRPDVFHMQWTRDLEFYTFLKTRFNVPIVVSLRGAHINYTPIITHRVADIYRNTFPNIDACHAVSKAIAQEASQYGNIQSKVSVIHSPVPSLFFDGFTPYRRCSNSHIKLVSVGRFHWKKGFRYAFDALSLLIEKGFQITYTIIGSKQLPEDLLFQMDQLHLQEHINLVEAMEQSKLIKTLQTFDLFLLPSVEEGIANVVLEAMAIGLPVISTDCGGMSEVVKHKETGWLVPLRNPKAIADAVIEVSNASEVELERITKNAHDFVKTHFDAEDSIRLFLELYDVVYSSSNEKIPTSLHSSE